MRDGCYDKTQTEGTSCDEGPERDEEAHPQNPPDSADDTTPAVPEPTRLDESQRMQIHRLYAEKGWTTRQIAAELRGRQAVRHAITPIAKEHLRALKEKPLTLQGAVLHRRTVTWQLPSSTSASPTP